MLDGYVASTTHNIIITKHALCWEHECLLYCSNLGQAPTLDEPPLSHSPSPSLPSTYSTNGVLLSRLDQRQNESTLNKHMTKKINNSKLRNMKQRSVIKQTSNASSTILGYFLRCSNMSSFSNFIPILLINTELI